MGGPSRHEGTPTPTAAGCLRSHGGDPKKPPGWRAKQWPAWCPLLAMGSPATHCKLELQVTVHEAQLATGVPCLPLSRVRQPGRLNCRVGWLYVAIPRAGMN